MIAKRYPSGLNHIKAYFILWAFDILTIEAHINFCRLMIDVLIVLKLYDQLLVDDVILVIMTPCPLRLMYEL
jgi:hypothetical protein